VLGLTAERARDLFRKPLPALPSKRYITYLPANSRELPNIYYLRNNNRFPDDFMFQLTKEEWNELLRSQNATSKTKQGGTSIVTLLT